jgi:hypothetical protein
MRLSLGAAARIDPPASELPTHPNTPNKEIDESKVFAENSVGRPVIDPALLRRGLGNVFDDGTSQGVKTIQLLQGADEFGEQLSCG